MANSFDKLRELELSRDEVERIGEALKNKEFRKLLSDYVEEVQNPENKKLYENEITQLEKERGIDVTFIHPKPGYVIKTSVNGSQKAFINICVNDHIKKPSSSPVVKQGERGLSWSLPHSLSPPREDIDNKGIRCQVFDVVFHSDTLHLAEKNKNFRTMVNSAALEAVESSFDVTIDKKNLKFPKLSYKGMPHASVIRKPSESKPVEKSPDEKELFDRIFAQAPSIPSSPSKKPKKTRRNSVEDNSSYTTPKYSIKHRSHVDIQDFTLHKESKMNAAIPKELIIEVHLPLLKSATDITLDVTEKTVQLISEKPAKYKLNLTLPYNVNESIGNAKFDKDLKKLVITLPVKRSTNLLLCDCKDDSGVESDQFSPGTPESEEEVSETHESKPLVSEHKPSEQCLENVDEFRTTKFLEENVHYTLPEFTCHVFENVIAFTLNVKNVDESSVDKCISSTDSSVHVKFTNIGSSYYPTYYAFLIKFSSFDIDDENVTVEVWDNNVVLQVPLKICDNHIKSYLYGVNEENLLEKYVEEPEIINQVLQENKELVQKKENDTHNQQEEKEVDYTGQDIEDKKVTGEFGNGIEENVESKQQSKAIDIVGSSYESSGDELSCSSYSPRKNKGILKRLPVKRFQVGRSISESSLDDFLCSSSFENCSTSLDSVIPEDGEISTSLKKTVRFNDVVTRQLFRSNSSILGQKKKNQRKSKNKKRAQERRHSESETSETDEKKEGDSKDCKQCDNSEQEDIEESTKKEDIFEIDIDN